MIDPGASNPVTPAAGSKRSPAERSQTPRKLLIVEPEDLLRWSMTTYLARWFEAFATDGREAAIRVLDQRRIDALVISDDLANGAADQLESHARSKNPAVRVVRTVTSFKCGRAPISSGGESSTLPLLLEKPFELAHLAGLLGVHDAAVRGVGENSSVAAPRRAGGK